MNAPASIADRMRIVGDLLAADPERAAAVAIAVDQFFRRYSNLVRTPAAERVAVVAAYDRLIAETPAIPEPQ